MELASLFLHSCFWANVFSKSYLSSTSKIYFQEMGRGWKQEQRMWVGTGAQLEFEMGIEGSFSCPFIVNSCASSELGLGWCPCALGPRVFWQSCMELALCGCCTLIPWRCHPTALSKDPFPSALWDELNSSFYFPPPNTQPLRQFRDQRTACGEEQRCSQINTYQAGRCWQGLSSRHGS